MWDLPPDPIVNYSAWLTFEAITPSILESAQERGERAGVAIEEFIPTSLEFSYTGRDSNWKIVRFLQTLAPALVQADGEVECSINGGDGDTLFEYYTITKGKLYCQDGRIERGASKEVVELKQSNPHS